MPETAAVDFDTDVLPILTKYGCNAAACHGAAAGRGGFKLSLFGGDPGFDYHAIVHQLEGRRVNLAHPDQSLLILKPTQQLDHEGGLRFDYDGKEAALLERWVQAGSQRIQQRRLSDLRISPTGFSSVLCPEAGVLNPVVATKRINKTITTRDRYMLFS